MDNLVLKNFSILVSFLTQTLGPDYEIALYSINNNNSKLIALANGGISEKNLGDSLLNRDKKLITEKIYLKEDFILNYSTIGKNEKVIRSSVMFLKDNKNNLIGLISISFDDSRYNELSEKILQLCHPNPYIINNNVLQFDKLPIKDHTTNKPKNKHDSLEAITDDVFSLILGDIPVPLEYLTKIEKLKIIEELHKKGVFLMKGAVPYVAEKLSTTPVSIYRYLNKIKNN